MKKNQIMRCLAAAAAAVLITTSTVPAYAMEYADAEVMDELSEFSEEDVYEASSDENHEGDSVLPADEPEDEELQENELEEEAYETDADESDDEFFAEEADETAEEDAAEEDESEDEFMGDPVAKVLIGVTETPFEKFDDAVAYWNTMGSGAKLILLRDVETKGTVAVSGGSSSLPMILDLNDHGILYKGSAYISVITVNSDAFLEIRDSSESKHDRYFSKDESGRATGFYGEDAEGRIKVNGGYIAGGTGNGTQYVSEGGGIKNSGTLTISGGTVCGNVSVTGGSGVWNEGTFTLNNGKICNNCSELGRGGGIRCDGGTVTIARGEISYNSAVDGGGVYLYGGTGFTMSDGMITHNATNSTKEHEGMGGGIFSQISNMEITDGEISYNSAQSGGGVWTGHLDFKGGYIKHNSATKEGGGIYGNSILTISGGEVKQNSCDGKGGGIYSHSRIVLNGAEIKENTAVEGGGVWEINGFDFLAGTICDNYASTNGGGVYADTGTFSFSSDGTDGTRRIIKDNNSYNGGGIYNNGTLLIIDGDIYGNRAFEGGGVYNKGTARIKGCLIYYNYADACNAFSNNGTLEFRGTIVAGVNLDVTGAAEVTSSTAIEKIGTYGYIKVIPESITTGKFTVTTADGKTEGYDDFDEAFDDWNYAGNGAVLKLYEDVTTYESLLITGSPLVLDLNDNGIMYAGDEQKRVLSLSGSNKDFTIQDSAETKTTRYITLSGEVGFRGTAVSITEPPAPGAKYVEVTGGYITGGDSNVYGGCIYADASKVTLNGGTICGNVSRQDGGGIFCGSWNGPSSFIMNGGAICSNYAATNGGGVYAVSSISVGGGEISRNKTGGYGGGIRAAGDCSVSGVNITNNEAEKGGGIYYSNVNNSNEFQLSGGKISQNKAEYGGGIAVTGETMISCDPEISGNTATAEGGGIYVFSGAVLTIRTSRITGNGSKNGAGIANYGTLIMDSGSIIYGNIQAEKGGGIYNKNVATLNNYGTVDSNGAKKGGGIYNSGTLNLAGADIVNNSVTGEGGGLYSDAGTVTMTGGMIKNNGAAGNGGGGGVYNINSTFILVDGVITENNATSSYSYGGGICNAGALEMRGGTVSRNNAHHGGGVCNENHCTFTMDSGKITNNKAYTGGGVENRGTFNLNGGKVTGNSSTGIGSAIFNSGDSFNMSSGEIAGDAESPQAFFSGGNALSFKGAIYASDDTEGKNLKHVSSSEAKENINTYGYLLVAPIDVASVASKSGQVKKYVDLSDAITAWNDAGAGAKLTVLDDAVTETVINVNAGTETDPMVLDLNGHGILLSSDSSSKNILMINSGASLELCDTGAKTERFIKLDANGKGTAVTDSVPEGDHIKVTGGYLTGLGNGNGTVKVASSSFRMNGGTIAGNTAVSGFGGGVTNDGKFVMNGGSIFGNTGITAGGVLNAQAGTFDMKGGSISGNSGNHGGVYNNGIFNLTDGNISDNTSNKGGGVYVDTAGVFTVSGGRINGNKATEKGGGVYTNTGSFTMKGGEFGGNDSPEGKAFFNNNGSIAFYGEVYASQNADGAGGKQYSAAEAPDLVKDMGYVSVLKLYAEKVDDMIYTGSAIVPAFKVYLGATLLKEKTDYSVTLKKNTDVGTAEFTISGKGNFSEKINGTFNIIKKNIGDSDVTAAEIASKAEGKTAYKPVPSLTYNKKKLATKEFTVKYYSDEACTQEVDAPIAAGHYWAKAIAAEKNFTGTKTVPFMITASNQIMVSKLTVVKIPDQQYESGKKIEPKITVKNGTKPVEPDWYDVSYSSNTEIGTAYVTITGKEYFGYIGSKTVIFKIVGNALSKAKVVDTGFVKAYEYSGTAKKNTITLLEKKNAQDPGTALSGMDKELYDGLPYGSAAKLAVDYVVSYENNVNAGTATMLMTGVNAWTGTVKKTFKIDKFNIKNNPGGKFAVTLDKSSYPFAKAGVKPKAEVKFNGKLLSEGTDYTVAYSNNTAVGGTKTPTVKVTGKGNFTGANESTTFSIEKADLAAAGITVTAKDVVWADKKGNYKTTVTVSDSDGKKLTANTDYTLTFSEHEDGSDPFGKDHKVAPGTTVYVIVTATDNAKSCYKNKAVGTYRVCSIDIGKLTAKVADQEYTGKPVTITKEDISWKSAGKPFDLPDECFEIVPGSYEKNISKGTASVTVKGKGEYGGTKKLTFAIKAKAFKPLD